jgi:hypothetical protein
MRSHGDLNIHFVEEEVAGETLLQRGQTERI